MDKRLFCGAGGGGMGATAMNNSINLKMYPVLSCVTWLKI
jgi:hypothetical protein